jgi:hypothetical protein
VNLDVSVAPEIAQLIEPRQAPHGSAPAPGASSAPGPAGADLPGDVGGMHHPTVGRLARELRLITAAPERWWGLVRFDPARPVRVAIPAGPWYEAWLMIIPPSEGGGWTGACGGSAGGGGPAGDGGECGCEVVTVVAGEVTEATGATGQAVGAPGPAATPLVPGRVRVHGPRPPHRVVNLGRTYAVTMHAHVRR